MKNLTRNAVYALHLKRGKGETYIHLFHLHKSGQIDIAMYTNDKEAHSTFRPDLITHCPEYSHDHWVDGEYDFALVASHVTDTNKLTSRDYKRMTKKAKKAKAQ